MKNFKKYKLLLSAMIIILNTVTVRASNVPDDYENPYDKIKELEKTIENLEDLIEPTPTTPVISLTVPTNITSVRAGGSQDIKITIKNVSNHLAEKIITEIKSIDDHGITASISGENYKPLLQGNISHSMTLKVSVDSTVSAGNYKINLLHKYTNNVGDSLSSDSFVTIRVINEYDGPNVVLENITVSKDNINAGDKFNLKAVIKNLSSIEAKNVQVKIDGLSSETVYVDKSTNIIDFASFSGLKSGEIDLPLVAYEKIKSGSYPITIQISYIDTKEKIYTKDYSYYINVNRVTKTVDAEESDLYLNKISEVGKTVTVGENFSMTVTVFNSGKGEAKNIKVRAVTDDGGAVVPKSTSIMQIKSLNAGASQNLTFSFAPTSKSLSQNYVIGFEVSYESGKVLTSGDSDTETPEKIEFTQYQGVNVYNPEADKKEEEKEDDKEEKISTPKIIVKEYQANPVIVDAGKNFTLSLTLENTSDKEVKNIRTVLTPTPAETATNESKGSVFTPVNSSNTFYVDSIPPKSTVVKTMEFYVLPDAAPKNYTIDVSMDYEDRENNPYETKDIIGINVKQTLNLEVGEITVDEMGSIGAPVYINFQFFNTGKVKLSNMKVDIEGEGFDTSQALTYYKTLTVSNNEYYDGTIIPTTEGKQDGKVVFTFEDETGEEHRIEKEFSVDVTAGMDMGMGMDEMGGGMMFDENGNPIMTDGMSDGAQKSKMPFIIIGVILVIIGVVVFVVKKRSKAKDETL